MRQGLTHLHPVDAGQFMNRKDITSGSPLICLLLTSAGSSFNSLLLTLLMIHSRNSPRSGQFTVHSVAGSQDVHTQGHFQQQVSFLEISLTSTTGPQGLQRPHRRQSPLLPGCTSPASFSLALGRAAFPLSVPLLCHLPSTPAWLWSQAEHLHLLGLGHLVLCWPVTSLSVFPVP